MDSQTAILEQKVKNLRPLFEPRSIAVIGASRRPEAVGYAILNNLISGGFKGKIFPVNPKADEICGVPCFASVKAIPEAIDLALIIVPNTAVPATLKESGEKGAQAAVIISAGFREIGGEGIQLEAEIKKIAQDLHIPVLGPNCLGLINTDPAVAINASFSRTMPRAGNIAFLSQSGALCAAILDYAKGKHIGFSKFVSLGNKTDVHELDMLRYLKNDAATNVILMYLEDLVNGRAFIDTVREITGEISPTKPILAIKSGRTPQGAKAASSHTGSLMGSDEVYDAIFLQAGVLRVDSVEEMFNFAIGFANQPLPRSGRVAIVTNAGGPGIMATDACVRYGLEMATLAPATIQKLKTALPVTASFSNPVDVIGDARHERYEAALQAVAHDPNVDGIIVILTPQAMTDIEDIAKVIVSLDKQTDKTILTCFMGIVDVSPGVKILEENHIPHYSFPEDAARTLGAMVRYQQWTHRPRTAVKNFKVHTKTVNEILAKAIQNQISFLTVDQSMAVLEAYEFPVLPYQLARSEAEAVQFSKKIGYPVAMKIVSRGISHKFDLGGVRLGLETEAQVQTAYRQMLQQVGRASGAKIDGVLIQAMAQKGWEVILGMKRDPHFGPILMFGIGGIYVETLRDVTFRLAPIRTHGARRMVESIRTFSLLKGMRGQKPSDIQKIMECLERLSQLSCAHPEILEIDINPLIVYPEGAGAAVADARIVVDTA